MEENYFKVWEPEKILEKEGSLKFAMLVLNQPVGKMESYVLSKWEQACFHIAVDGGLLSLQKLANDKNVELVPELITGDFDSVTKDVLTIYERKGSKIIPTPDQDETDFTKAIRVLIDTMKEKDIQIDVIITIAAMSGRLDHIMGNLQTLYLATEMTDTPVYLVSDQCLTWLLSKGKHRIKISPSFFGLTVGLIPLGKPSYVTTSGLKWNLENGKLEFGSLVSTSNTYDGSEHVNIETDENLIWTMEVKHS